MQGMLTVYITRYRPSTASKATSDVSGMLTTLVTQTAETKAIHEFWRQFFTVFAMATTPGQVSYLEQVPRAANLFKSTNYFRAQRGRRRGTKSSLSVGVLEREQSQEQDLLVNFEQDFWEL